MSLPEPSGGPRPTFYFEWGGSADLTVEEIWPDGNAPENPTTADVIVEMQRCRSVRTLCRDWNLDVQSVEVNGTDCGLR